MLKIFGAPGRYIQGPGAIESLGEWGSLLGRRAALVIDRHVHTLIGARLAAICAHHGIALHEVIVDGDLTPALIDRVRAQAREAEPQFVIGVGGGKAIDAGKAVAHALHCHLVTVPTVASNDAPTSKNYVLYDEHHNLLTVEHMLFNPTIVIADTQLIATAPKALFLAGLGDAISKKFEAEQCFRKQGKTMFDAQSTLTAQRIANSCFEVLIADAEEALAAVGTGEPTDAFERVVEAMILMSGLGFESGGLSIAHALTRGLPCIAGLATAQHGLQVAVGLLVQLDLEARSDDMPARLANWYRRVGLPRTLRELGATRIDATELRLAAERTMTARHTANFQTALDAHALFDALQRRA
jgi:glycerol dehydrogenase